MSSSSESKKSQVRFGVRANQGEYTPIIEIDLADGEGREFTIYFEANLSTKLHGQANVMINHIADILTGKYGFREEDKQLDS